jgi:hypothetical protein
MSTSKDAPAVKAPQPTTAATSPSPHTLDQISGEEAKTLLQIGLLEQALDDE